MAYGKMTLRNRTKLSLVIAWFMIFGSLVVLNINGYLFDSESLPYFWVFWIAGSIGAAVITSWVEPLDFSLATFVILLIGPIVVLTFILAWTSVKIWPLKETDE